MWGAQGRFLDMDSFSSSETKVAPQSSWMCFRDHQSGKEFRCTIPAGFGLMPGWVHVELCLKRGKTEGIIFYHPDFFFEVVTEYCKNGKWLLFFPSILILFTPLVPSGDFFPLWFPYHESPVFRIICWEDHVLQWDSVVCGCSCQDDIPEMSRFNKNLIVYLDITGNCWGLISPSVIVFLFKARIQGFWCSKKVVSIASTLL